MDVHTVLATKSDIMDTIEHYYSETKLRNVLEMSARNGYIHAGSRAGVIQADERIDKRAGGKGWSIPSFCRHTA
jgi:hypothetical protein